VDAEYSHGLKGIAGRQQLQPQTLPLEEIFRQIQAPSINGRLRSLLALVFSGLLFSSQGYLAGIRIEICDRILLINP
jgi:hypothetical protein